MLIPHEPDLGFGRPGAQTSLLQSASSWVSGSLSGASAASGTASSVASAPNSVCSDHAAACVAALGVLDSVQSVTVRGLAQVKADIEEQQRERALRTTGN
jgi:hypothetical protein